MLPPPPPVARVKAAIIINSDYYHYSNVFTHMACYPVCFPSSPPFCPDVCICLPASYPIHPEPPSIDSRPYIQLNTIINYPTNYHPCPCQPRRDQVKLNDPPPCHRQHQTATGCGAAVVILCPPSPASASLALALVLMSGALSPLSTSSVMMRLVLPQPNEFMFHTA